MTNAHFRTGLPVYSGAMNPPAPPREAVLARACEVLRTAFPFVRGTLARTFRKASSGRAEMVVASLDPDWDFEKGVSDALGAALPVRHLCPGEASLAVSLAIGTDVFDLVCTHVSPGQMHFASEYLSYGRAGDLMGPVARQCGFVLRHTGLFVVTDGQEEGLVSRDFQSVAGFLGYRAALWRRGFDTRSELFGYLSCHVLFGAGPFAGDPGAPFLPEPRISQEDPFTRWLADHAITFCPNSAAAEALRRSALARACSAFPGFARRRGLHEGLCGGMPAQAQSCGLAENPV